MGPSLLLGGLGALGPAAIAREQVTTGDDGRVRPTPTDESATRACGDNRGAHSPSREVCRAPQRAARGRARAPSHRAPPASEAATSSSGGFGGGSDSADPAEGGTEGGAGEASSRIFFFLAASSSSFFFFRAALAAFVSQVPMARCSHSGASISSRASGQGFGNSSSPVPAFRNTGRPATSPRGVR